MVSVGWSEMLLSKNQNMTARRLYVKHRILQVPMNAVAPHPDRGLVRLIPVYPRTGLRRAIPKVHEHVQIFAPALARKVSVVRGRDETNGLGRAHIQVARSMCALLYCVRIELVLVIDHNVVCCFDMSLKSVVRLDEQLSVSFKDHLQN